MAQDFLKLEKIEYGGVKGTMLSEVTLAMFGEFNDLFKTFTDSSYDPLDLTDDVSDDVTLHQFQDMTQSLICFGF